MSSEKNLYEDRYLKYVNKATANELQEKINKIRVTAFKLEIALSKDEREKLREIENASNLTEENNAFLSNLLIALNKKKNAINKVIIMI